MKRLALIWLALLLCTGARAQEGEVLERILQKNLPPSLEAAWQREYHSPLLQENLSSSGKVYLLQPDKLRWETVRPFSRVSVFDGTEPRGRFRMPAVKDFRSQLFEGDQYTVILTPVRRDLKQLFNQIILTVNKDSLLVQEILVKGPDGDWTRIVFTDIRHNPTLSESLFQKPSAN